MAAALGTNFKHGFGSTSTVDHFLEVISDTVKLTRPILHNAGMIGTRSQRAERAREGPRSVAGTISFNPDPVTLDAFLPYIMGGSESADVFALTDSLPSFYWAADREVKVPVYSGCTVNRAVISASRGGYVQIDADIIGIDETVGNAASFPAISLDVTTAPYVFTDAAVTVGGTSYSVDQFSVTVDNQLEVQFFNSLTATRINPTGREVSVSLTLPYGDASAAYGPAVTGVAVVITLTNGSKSLTLSMGSVQFTKESAVANGRGEAFLILNGIARRSGSTLELVTTNDPT